MEPLQIELLIKGRTLLTLLKKSNIMLKRFCIGIFDTKVLYTCLKVTQINETEWRLLFEVQQKIGKAETPVPKGEILSKYLVQLIDYAEK